MRNRVLVTGAGGFIGHHMVRLLKSQGHWVRGVDKRYPEYSPTAADEFVLEDLRTADGCRRALTLSSTPSSPNANPVTFDHVYHFAADMGGMGFIHSSECDILRNSTLINATMPHVASEMGVRRYFLASSVCVYRNMVHGEPELCEDDAYPALPDNEYGWEKLFAERVASAYARRSEMQVRIARFQNCYGQEGAWRGGREKAPAALCRKVAEAEDGGYVEIWGDGSAVRAYIHVYDLVEAVSRLMQSDIEGPVNIGAPEYVSVNELFELVQSAAGKSLRKRHIEGPVGVQSRNFSNEKILSLGWRPMISLRQGISMTYAWVDQQVRELGSRRRQSPAEDPHLASSTLRREVPSH